ncbi:Pleckstrin y domain-containing family G member 1 [Choanephora cucurbitarum]|uniref:Pleckstrin y domain-containing family G member 1 n=1 Tax=Choanephora cucurbitarum TaxID=101091 RepID=A0A1C7N1W2_9FUNG|nr:Pleckstrin y domain-containing family G member 1 [Choanephora cucurbitarum]
MNSTALSESTKVLQSSRGTLLIDDKNIQQESNEPEKMQKKKLLAIEELLQTEHDYVQDLFYLVQVYLETLSRQPWISQEHKQIIVRNAPDIFKFHKQFIASFSAGSLTYDFNSSIVAKKFLDQPVQRICRYHLLIREIIRYTSPQTAEYDLWNVVLSEMQDVVSEINDFKLQRDMKERTELFIKRLDEDWRMSKQHLTQLGNLLIAGGIEVTYSALGQSVSKPRYLGCFVFNTYIIMVRPKKVISYEPKHWFPLHLTDFEDLPNIEVRCKKHTFAFSASCAQEKQAWIKKIQEAISYAKDNYNNSREGIMMPHDFIVSSLPGLSNKQSSSFQKLHLSRSFSSLLDMSGGSHKINEREAISNSPVGSYRALHADLKSNNSDTIVSDQTFLKSISNEEAMKKGQRANHPNHISRRSQSSLQLQLGAHSDLDVSTDYMDKPTTCRRPSSLELLSSNSNMIGKMSLQFKSNQQNAFRITVDHKLRDVCTQEYLSSRAWHVRDKDQTTGESMATESNLLKKRKSTSFIRTSASSFSLIKRATTDSTKLALQTADLEDPLTGSYPSSIDRSGSPINHLLDKIQLGSSMQGSSSSQLLRGMSFIRVDSPLSYDSESSINSNSSQKRVERKTSRRHVLVDKVLRRITSVHHKHLSSSSERSSFGFDGDHELKKAAFIDTKMKHEESSHLEINDRPSEETENAKKERQIVITGDQNNTSTCSFSAFAYASTPIPVEEEPIKKKKKWKTKLNRMRPASFLKLAAN